MVLLALSIFFSGCETKRVYIPRPLPTLKFYYADTNFEVYADENSTSVILDKKEYNKLIKQVQALKSSYLKYDNQTRKYMTLKEFLEND